MKGPGAEWGVGKGRCLNHALHPLLLHAAFKSILGGGGGGGVFIVYGAQGSNDFTQIYKGIEKKGVFIIKK
jgi:hypothetical protein